MPSPDRASATTCERCSGSGSPATRTPPAGGVPTEIGLGTNLVGTDDMILARLRLYRDAGITMLRAGLGDGDLDTRLSNLAHLLDLIGRINAEVGT